MGDSWKQGLERVKRGNEVLPKELILLSSPVSTLLRSSQPGVVLLQKTFPISQGLVNKPRSFQALGLSLDALL